MAVIWVRKTKDYTVMSNYHLRDKSISLKAKGLLSQILSLPENWNYTVNGLSSINKEGSPAIASALDELKQAGYIVVTKRYPSETKTGRIEYCYDIYETPQNGKQGVQKQGVEIQGVEKQGLEFQGVENVGLYKYTDVSSKEKVNTEESVIYGAYAPDTQKSAEKATRFRKPTVEEVEGYCKERKNGIDAERFVDYYEMRGWKIGKTSMKDWKAAVRTWERNEKQKAEENPGAAHWDDLDEVFPG